ncbi:hypothetical protein FPE01S_03_00250 [Flavihumibacter petaseus NBRC 106054]|uniref:Uncharacterized protein n=1 Tax=Flavihumibacter petaseus NBRC 106054 TaxID=1220578 RepID=A0A0E9N2V2_9BACT|nr:hypothetical protein FPE01S_03_00250 [Flavihumibacter petaseus NBRC 106054]
MFDVDKKLTVNTEKECFRQPLLQGTKVDVNAARIAARMQFAIIILYTDVLNDTKRDRYISPFFLYKNAIDWHPDLISEIIRNEKISAKPLSSSV